MRDLGCPACRELTNGDCGKHDAKDKAMPVSQGWICPKCGYVWGSWVKGCENCNRLIKVNGK